MDVDFIFRIAAIGIIVTVLNLVLVRSGREDQAMLTTLAGARGGAAYGGQRDSGAFYNREKPVRTLKNGNI